MHSRTSGHGGDFSRAPPRIEGCCASAATSGGNVTYTSPRRWLPGFQPLDGETALRALLKRYLYVYGPVAPQHFATWLAIQPRRAAELFESAARDLERVVVDGARAWTLAGDTAAPGDPHRGVRLLPYFDAYVVGGQPRARLYPGPAARGP